MNLTDKKILVTGGAGFFGSWVVKNLWRRGVPRENIFIPRSRDFDLRKEENCKKVVENQYLVIHLAARVGGIGYNLVHPGELFYDNLIMGAQMMEAARLAGVKKFVAVGTICAYPKFSSVPFREENFWEGYPEETNAPYGLAKKMMLVQAQAYRTQYGFNAIYLLPVNLYGPGDTSDPERAHVIPALIKKIKEAKDKNLPSIEVWGTGSASREFIYVDDAAEAIILAAEKYDGPEPVNIGSGREISIKDLVSLLCRLMDYPGKIRWDASRSEGQPRRLLDVSRAKKYFGFEAKTFLEDGLRKTIDRYLANEI